MIYIADRVNLLPPDTAKDRLIKDAACDLGRIVQFQWIAVPGLEALPSNTPHQHTTPNDAAPVKRPRQAILVDDENKLLPPELCQKCRQWKRWINLKNGVCLMCRAETMSTNLSSHLLSLHKLMFDRDRAAYAMSEDEIPSQMAERDVQSSDDEVDFPEPDDAFDSGASPVDDNDRAHANVAAATLVGVPIWEKCVWCENKSGPDGLCDTCRTSNNPYYNVEHTNFPLTDWFNFF